MRRLLDQAVVGLILGLGLLLAATPARAQSWPAPKGEGYFSFLYGNLLNVEHYAYDGSTFDSGHIHSNTFRPEIGYAITDRLSIRANLPYQSAKYVGKGPHMFPVDDGSYHGTLTDFLVEARYNVLNRTSVAVTPFVATILPSHHYEYFGHAVNGLDLKQFLIGTGFGFRSTHFLPNAYLMGRYAFSFVEKVQDVHHNRSNMDLQLSYNLTPRLQLFAGGFGQYVGVGTDLNLAVIGKSWSAETFHHHVQTGRSQLWGLGGGADFQLTGAIDVQGAYAQSLGGENDHQVDHLITFTVYFGFSPRQILRRMSTSRPAAATMAAELF